MEHFSFGGWEGVYADHDSNDSHLVTRTLLPLKRVQGSLGFQPSKTFLVLLVFDCSNMSGSNVETCTSSARPADSYRPPETGPRPNHSNYHNHNLSKGQTKRFHRQALIESHRTENIRSTCRSTVVSRHYHRHHHHGMSSFAHTVMKRTKAAFLESLAVVYVFGCY